MFKIGGFEVTNFNKIYNSSIYIYIYIDLLKDPGQNYLFFLSSIKRTKNKACTLTLFQEVLIFSLLTRLKAPRQIFALRGLA